MMRLITGGSGFLGIAMARLLVEKGCGVRVFDLKRSEDLPDSVDFFSGDIRDAGAVMDACAGVSHVYHFAALLPQRKASKKMMREVHIGGTENVLRACEKQKVESVVSLSSTETYGKMKTIPCPEDAPQNPIGEYGRNKVSCEKLCMFYVKGKGLRISIVRPPTLIGPGILDEGIIMMMEQVRRGGVLPIIGGGGNRAQALDVRDCAEAVFLCGERPEAEGEAFNVSCGDVPTMLEMAEAMKKKAGTNVKIIKVPAAIGINALRLLNLFDASPIRPEHYELMTSDFVSNITKIGNMLGWKPEKSYSDSVADMYDWHLKNRQRKSG